MAAIATVWEMATAVALYGAALVVSVFMALWSHRRYYSNYNSLRQFLEHPGSGHLSPTQRDTLLIIPAGSAWTSDAINRAILYAGTMAELRTKGESKQNKAALAEFGRQTAESGYMKARADTWKDYYAMNVPTLNSVVVCVAIVIFYVILYQGLGFVVRDDAVMAVWLTGAVVSLVYPFLLCNIMKLTGAYNLARNGDWFMSTGVLAFGVGVGLAVGSATSYPNTWIGFSVALFFQLGLLIIIYVMLRPPAFIETATADVAFTYGYDIPTIVTCAAYLTWLIFTGIIIMNIMGPELGPMAVLSQANEVLAIWILLLVLILPVILTWTAAYYIDQIRRNDVMMQFGAGIQSNGDAGLSASMDQRIAMASGIFGTGQLQAQNAPLFRSTANHAGEAKTGFHLSIDSEKPKKSRRSRRYADDDEEE